MWIVFALLVLTIAIPVLAQDAAQPAVNLPTGPAEQSTPLPIPSATPALPELSALDQAFDQSQTGLGKDVEEMRTRIELRKLQNQVARDPAVLAAKAAAERAPTDLEKRELLREYYNINFALMAQKASNPAEKAAIDQSKREHIGLLAQPRVRPGVFEPGPSATPKKKKAKKAGKRF
jgi:hypothetical protein